MYSTGTQYSDPVYEAVIKIDRTPITPSNNDVGATGQTFDFNQFDGELDAKFSTVPDWDDEMSDFTMIPPATVTAPPLPPRNLNRNPSITETKQPSIDRTNKVDRLKVAAKLYENVIENRSYDAELVAFYNMVSDRSIFHKDEFKKENKRKCSFVPGETCSIAIQI